MDEYSFQVLSFLTDEEIAQLHSDCYPFFIRLAERYLPNHVRVDQIPLDAAILDVVRGFWLLDKNPDRPGSSDVVSGVGFAFGQLICTMPGYRWAHITDDYGERTSVVGQSAEYKDISVPPFSYVEKRENTQNVEVFQDFFKQMSGVLFKAN